MAEVAFGNYHYQNYGNQGIPNMQQYSQSPPMQVVGSVPSRLGHQVMQNQRYNPYQRPSPPAQQQQHMRLHHQQQQHQHQQQQHMRQPQIVSRHSYNPNQQWINTGKVMQQDYNANSNPMYFNQASRQSNNWQQQNNGFYHQENVMRQQQVSPPLIPSANFQNNSQDLIQDQVGMRRRMSSSSQCSDYSSMAPSNDGRQWMVSPNTNPVQQGAQFHPQGSHFASQASPNTGTIPTWNGSLPHSTPSPLSSISSENSSPPPPYVPFNQQTQFRHPSAIQPPVPKLQPPVPQVNVPLVSTDIPPGTTTGTSGNDWAVNCLGTEVKLRNSDLWKHFDNVVMEMVISKHGRRMFPVLEYDIKGLHPFKLYSVFVDFVLANKYVWKFSEQKWNPSGLAPDEDAYDQSHRVCLHPDSPAPGEVWNKRGASFSKMKLSNHLHTESDKLSLKSLHKYQPRLHVVEVDPRDPTIQTNLRTFIIPKTRFMTVTLYHNTDVAQLKINLNPFARCFRDKEISPMSKPIENSADRQPERSAVSYDVTSPNNCENLESISVGSPTSHEQKTIYKVQNPISESDLTRAKNFMQAQMNTMTQLVRTQDALNQGSEPIKIEQEPVEERTEEIKRAPLHAVDFDRELEGLLSSIDNRAAKKAISASAGKGPEKKTVHHYPPASEGRNNDMPKTKYIKKEKPKSDENSLDKYELLNVDRDFPPNAVAPLSNTLPFDPSDIKNEKFSRDNDKILPPFFKCSYYQEQAAAQAGFVSNKQNNNERNLPVVYVPKPITSTSTTVAAEQHEISEIRGEEQHHHGLDTSPTSSAASSESIASFNPFPLPTLSPKSLRQFLDDDLNEMMSGNKRKCSFDDDIDDDVFGNDTSLLNVCGMFQGQQQQPIQQYLSTQGFL